MTFASIPRIPVHFAAHMIHTNIVDILSIVESFSHMRQILQPYLIHIAEHNSTVPIQIDWNRELEKAPLEMDVHQIKHTYAYISRAPNGEPPKHIFHHLNFSKIIPFFQTDKMYVLFSNRIYSAPEICIVYAISMLLTKSDSNFIYKEMYIVQMASVRLWLPNA